MAKRLVCVLGGLSVSVAAIFPVVNRPKSLRSGDDTERRKLKINEAIKQSRKLINRLKNEVGAPGIVVGVSVDGEQVWKEGIGYADLENEVEAHEDTVMRIASISKSLTAAVVARLWQDGVIDIDKPVQSYVPTFPEKIFGKKKVTISTRQLMCHLSGIRHYSTKKKEESDGSGDGQFDEFYSKDRYDSVEKALAIFKDDDLLFEPGSKFLYTTYGWTLVSAVMEGATGKTYPQIMRAFLRELGMRRTYLDQPEPIIYGRSKCYNKNKNGRIVNSPYVDNSCKWAGGGFLSTVGDLLTFSNALLFAFQRDGDIEMNYDKYHYSATTVKKKESVSHAVSSDLGSVVSSITSGASSVWKYGSSLIKGDQSESIKKDNKDNEFDDSSTAIKKSESILEEVKSGTGSGVGSITSGVSENNITTSKRKESVSKEVTSDLRSEVGNITSGVVSEANSKIAKKSESGSKVVTKGIASGVDNITSGAFSTSVKKSESVSKEVTSELGSRVNRISSGVVSEANSTTVKKSESGSKEVTSGFSSRDGSITSGVVSEANSKITKKSESGSQEDKSGIASGVGSITSGVVSEANSTITEKSESGSQEDKSGIASGVGSITSGVVSGASSVWKYGSSLIWGDESESFKKDIKDNEFDNSSTTIKKSESILEEVKSDSGSGIDNITSGVVSGASSVRKYGSSLIWGDESESIKKDIKDNEFDDSSTTIKKSESILEEVKSGSGVGSITSGIVSGASSVWKYGSSWLGSSEKDKEKEKSESILEKVKSATGSGVDSITSGVVSGASSVWKYGSSWIWSSENDKEKEKSESILEKVKSATGSGVESITSGVVSGASSVWKYGSSLIRGDQSESIKKDNNDNELHESDTKIKKSESILEEVKSDSGSGVDSITSGVVSGASSVWKYGSSWLGSSEKDKEKENSESILEKVKSGTGSRVDSITSGVVSGASSVWKYGSSWLWSSEKDKEKEKSESILEKVKSGTGSGVDSITSGVVSGASSVWKYGSSWLGSSEKDKETEKSESILEKVKAGTGSGVDSITSGVVSAASSVWKYGSSWLWSSEKDKEKENSESILEKVKSGTGSGVDSITSGVVSGASSVWKYGSSWLWSSEKDKEKEKSESILEKVKSGTGSGVDSITSGVVSGASSVWKYGSSWLWNSEKEKENGSGKSILSSLSNLFKPKALDNNEVFVITNEKHKEVSSFPATNLTDKLFWNDIVIPYAICAVKGKLSERVVSHSDEEDYENFNVIDSPFFSKRLNREPYILPSTVAKLWTRVDGTILKDWGPHVEGGYGLGFGVASPIDSPGGVDNGGQPYIVGHTGGAVGASSAMIIVPRKCHKEEPPKGIAVVLMCNLQSVSLNPLAIEIAKIFSLL